MKKMYVLDASVLIKWFSDEEYTDIALKLRDDFFKGNIELVVPDLLLYEVSETVSIRVCEYYETTDKHR